MRAWLLVGLAGCWSAKSAPPREPLVQNQNRGNGTGCGTIVELRGHPADKVNAALAAKHLTRVSLIEHVLPVRDDPSDVVRTLRVDGRDVRGIVEIMNGRCVHNATQFAADSTGNIWKLEPPSGVVDYAGRRCETDKGWIACDLSGQVTRFFELPADKTLVRVLNPDTGLEIEIPPDR